MDGAYTNGYSRNSAGRDRYGGDQDTSRDVGEETSYRERNRPGHGAFRGGRQPSGGVSRQVSGGVTRQVSGGVARQVSGSDARQLSGGYPRQTSGSGWPSNGLTSGISRNRNRSRNRSRSRVRTAEGPAAREIEGDEPTRINANRGVLQDVLHDVRQDWNFMTEDKCIPAQVALQLLDESSLGLAARHEEFQALQAKLQNALKGIVNEHHQGFSNSIGTFHQIQTSIQASQERVRLLRTRMVAAKSNLTTTKSEYQSMVTASHNFEEMLDVFTKIEEIKQIPEQLEARISEKRFIGAVECLQEGLRLIKATELEHVSALSDMKVYLGNQEHVLTDILIEELHNHLYLKSPYCEKRWTSYAKDNYQGKPIGVIANADNTPRELYAFLGQLDTTTIATDDTSRNPEADSFHYIYAIVESLAKLGRLEDAVDAVDQRLPIELYRVVDRTNHEVAKRHPKATRSMMSPTTSASTRSWDNRAQKAVLEDLLASLYARFEAIAEAHRALNDVISGVSKREAGFSKPRLTRGFKELWKLYQSEMRSILHDYLSTDTDESQRASQNFGHNTNVFRQQRDKEKKPTFKMDLLDTGVADFRQDQDEVFNLWQKFVPGLVSLQQAPAESARATTNTQQDASATGHRLLVDPDVFNIIALLPASIIFIRRFQDLVPTGADIPLSTIHSFLHDFLVNVFHPQLEETLTEFCTQSYIELDAFQPHPQWAQFAQKPIFQGTVTFFETLSAFCNMIGTLPHDQSFSQLAMQQIHNYNERCTGWFKALISRVQPKSNGQRLRASATFAIEGPLSEHVARIWDAEPRNVTPLMDEETQLLLAETSSLALDEIDLIIDRKTQSSLCLLYTSMKWLAMKLAGLRYISSRALDSTDDDPGERSQLRRSLTALDTELTGDGDLEVYLPLSEKTAPLFDGIVNGYRDLAEVVLRTLRLEPRCQALEGFGGSFRGSFVLVDADETPSIAVLTTIKRLLDFNQEVALCLQPQEYDFVIAGFSSLVDASLVRSIGRNTSALNTIGVTHITSTLDAIYHNLLKVDPGADLPRAYSYLRLYLHGPDAIVAAAAGGSAGVPPGTFTAEQLRQLLKLKYAEPISSGDVEAAAEAREAMSAKLNQLEDILRRDAP